MPSSTKTKVLRSFSGSRCDIMPMASGSIMAVVAVLLIHIDRKAVTAKSARTDTSMLPRDSEISHRAILRSSFWTCSAVASAKPPKKM